MRLKRLMKSAKSCMQKLIAEMNDTETSSKKQCSDCALYWEIGFVHCTCGRYFENLRKELRSWTRTTSTSLSIPGYVIKENTIRGAKHGPSERERMEMFQKALQPKHGGYKSILERWHKEDKYRKSHGHHIQTARLRRTSS